MKKKHFIIGILLFFIATTVKAAPSYTLNVSKSTIGNGEKVTASITVRNTAAWNVKITSTGATSGCSNSWADASSSGDNLTKTLSTTCRATSTGTISFVLSGDITSADGETINVSGNKSVTVTEAQARAVSDNTAASTINTLSSLSIEGYEITPEFDPNVLEYTANIGADTDKINIKAVKKDSKSKVTGDGEVTIEEGTNKIEIIVTSESGATKTYTITVNVEDKNPVLVQVDGKEYTIVKNAKLLKAPDGYTLTTITINDEEFPALYNEITNIALVGLKDQEGNINLYIYNADNNSYTLYREITNELISIIILKPDELLKNYQKEKNISINDEEVKAYYNDNMDINTVLIYGMNTKTGKTDWYVYDLEEKTFQKYRSTELDNFKKNQKEFMKFTIFFASCFGISILMLILSILNNSKLRKKNKKLINIAKNNPNQDEYVEEKIEEPKEVENEIEEYLEEVKDINTEQNNKKTNKKLPNKKKEKANLIKAQKEFLSDDTINTSIFETFVDDTDIIEEVNNQKKTKGRRKKKK